MNESLKGRVIIVTGGTGRLGSAVTPLLLSRGATVVVTYTKEDELKRLEKSLSAETQQNFHWHKIDVTDQTAVSEFVTATIKSFGRIDGLANLVGGWESAPFVELDAARFMKQINLNLISAFVMTRAVLPHMIAAEYGRIIGMGARSAIQAAKDQAHYNISKVGVMWLMETISNEVKQYGVTANAILPSAIKTKKEHAADPGGSWATPEEIAEVIAFYLSPESGVTSGAKIPVYGKA